MGDPADARAERWVEVVEEPEEPKAGGEGMIRIWTCAVLVGAGIVWTDPVAGYTRVQVGREYAVRVVIQPEITQIDGQDGVISSKMPDPPYTWQFKYDRSLVQFLRASDGVTATYKEIPSSPYATLTCETSSTESFVFWRALKATDGQIAAPVQNATANGAALEILNPDRLDIDPQRAVLHVIIEAIEPEQ